MKLTKLKNIIGILSLALFSTSGFGAVKVGVLHSLSGTMAISETSLKDVVMMAVKEINDSGGVLGQQVEAVVVDPASDWPLFAEKAKQLITEDRIMGVETGGCPHTAIRDDTSMNAVAIEQLQSRHPDVKLVLLESGGDNLSATFSPELVDAFIFVIDVAEGDKIPRKGGPAIRYSDLLIINKTDLAPLVGADLEVMDRDSKKMREERPYLFTDLKTHKGLDGVVDWLTKEFLF